MHLWLIAYFPARNYKIILCTFTEYKNGQSIYDWKIKKERTVKHQSRAFSSIKNKQTENSNINSHYIKKLDVEGQSYQQYFKQNYCVRGIAHKRILSSFVEDQTHPCRFWLFNTWKLNAYAGGWEVEGINQEPNKIGTDT